MKTRRFDPSGFNPEKFLAKEAKKTSLPTQPLLDEILPIMFSKARRKALIARLAVEAPDAFYRGEDSVKIRAAIAALQAEIKKELGSAGIAQDPVLANFLLFDVIRDPAWRRTVRRKKHE